ncbi:MAG TPA: hypothetical protein PKA95_10970 [Thermomicrobiales bacterium]|nr:hypothetical protein [Thermomicrobiales bacterium]
MLPYRTRWLLFLFALSLGAMATAGCRDAGMPTDRGRSVMESPTATTQIIRSTATPVASPSLGPLYPVGSCTPNPSDPFNFGIFPDQVGTGPGALGYVSVSQLIVTGHVVEMLPTRWTTADGTRPANPHEGVPQTTTIVTPFVVSLDGPPLLNRTSESLDTGQVVALINGGIVGDDSLTIHLPWMELAIGERVLITLDANPTWLNPPGPVATSKGPGWWLTMKWTLTDDGQAVSYLETRDATEVEAEFRAAIEFLDPLPQPTRQIAP